MNDMRQFAGRRLSRLLGKFALEVKRTSRSPRPEAVHDLRVSIRRLEQGLRAFYGMLPHKESKKVRQRLRRLRELAGYVRDRDIALGLLAQAGLPAGAECVRQLAGERKSGEEALEAALTRFRARDFASRWRADLELPPK